MLHGGIHGPKASYEQRVQEPGQHAEQIFEGSDVEDLLQPKLVGGVLVMPGGSFALSSNVYAPKEEARLSPALVEHHYAGTWKNSHSGED